MVHTPKVLGTTVRAKMAAQVIKRAFVVALSLATFAGILGGIPQADAHQLRFTYQRGYYIQHDWLCYGWSNTAYHCTRWWHRTASGALVSDNPAWVPNYGATTSHTSAVKHADGEGEFENDTSDVARSAAPVRTSAPAHTTANGAQASAPLTSKSAITNEIMAVFGAYGSQAVRVATCESGLNPNAYNAASGASGLFQFLASTWRTTSYASYSPFNANANIHAAYQVFHRDGNSWREWVCQP